MSDYLNSEDEEFNDDPTDAAEEFIFIYVKNYINN